VRPIHLQRPRQYNREGRTKVLIKSLRQITPQTSPPQVVVLPFGVLHMSCSAQAHAKFLRIFYWHSELASHRVKWCLAGRRSRWSSRIHDLVRNSGTAAPIGRSLTSIDAALGILILWVAMIGICQLPPFAGNFLRSIIFNVAFDPDGGTTHLAGSLIFRLFPSLILVAKRLRPGAGTSLDIEYILSEGHTGNSCACRAVIESIGALRIWRETNLSYLCLLSFW